MWHGLQAGSDQLPRGAARNKRAVQHKETAMLEYVSISGTSMSNRRSKERYEPALSGRRGRRRP